jgi:hypothetical protein
MTDLLSSNTGLRTLTINGLPLVSLHDAWVPVLLSQVTSLYIEEISFIMLWDRLDILRERVNLELIQNIITKRVFSGLKRVIFRWVGAVGAVEASQEIRVRMDQLNEMGLLVFHYDGPFPRTDNRRSRVNRLRYDN